MRHIAEQFELPLQASVVVVSDFPLRDYRGASSEVSGVKKSAIRPIPDNVKSLVFNDSDMEYISKSSFET